MPDHIVVSEPTAARRKLAVELGATPTIDPTSSEDFVAEVRLIVPRGVNYILDTTGKAKVISGAMAALDHRGALGVVAIPATADDMVLPVNVLGVLGHGLQIKGISEGDVDPQTFIPSLIDLYMSGEFPFDKLIASYPLEEINEEIRESFEEAGGDHFDYIPCLNDDDDHIAALSQAIEDSFKGWLR